jgi:hypothetical protein
VRVGLTAALNSVVPTCAYTPGVAAGGFAVASIANTSASGRLTRTNGSKIVPYASIQWLLPSGPGFHLTMSAVSGCGMMLPKRSIAAGPGMTPP